ncbi:MAG: hypothetical protein OXC68_02890 [Aestuariivita sp.]|nr:hypothetical protein [Aestuariivita sp.]
MKRPTLVLSIILVWNAISVHAEPFLLVAEEIGCVWCERWDQDIAEIYPKTPEGRAAPLLRFNLYGEIPDIQFKQTIRFTPTFILVNNGLEINRIEGYPGEDFFWGLLQNMLEQAEIPMK